MESHTNQITIPMVQHQKENLPINVDQSSKKVIVDQASSAANNEQNDKSISDPSRKSAFGNYIKQEQKKAESQCKNEEKNKCKRIRMKKPRKIRTLITKQKLLRMNKIFTEFSTTQNLVNRGKNKIKNLKDIAVQLELGYSTILHKYRQYRANKKVKAGALIASMQKKRKYKKSLEVENMIRTAMETRQFYTASQMTDYIEANFGKKFSRSIISRHLGQMGFSYKNVTGGIHSNNGTKLEKIKRIYAEIIWPLIQSEQALIYFDQMSCCIRGNQQNNSTVPDNPTVLTLTIAASVHGILYFQIFPGFMTRQKFIDSLKEFLVNLKASDKYEVLLGSNQQIYIVTDLDSIHRDSCQQQTLSNLAPMLIQENAQILYIPPNTPEFNPLEQIFFEIKDIIKTKMSLGQIYDFRTLELGLQNIMQELRFNKNQEVFESLKIDIARNLVKRPKIDS